MKEQNFRYLVEMADLSESEAVRSECFKIFGSLARNESKAAMIELLEAAKVVPKIA